MSSRVTKDDARALGLEILRAKPDPAVRVRLLRDVLCADHSDPRLRDARAALEDSVHVQPLRAGQGADGSWGRLHSRDTLAAQAIPTTEWAVERALALGFDAEHPLLDAAAKYLASVLEGRTAPADPPEGNDRWATGVRLFAAATLARIHPRHASIDAVWELWHEIARRAFAGGAYDADAEVEAHRVLTGASVRGTYLVLANRYTLILLGSRADQLDAELRRSVGRWVGRRPDGVGYLGIPLDSLPSETTPGTLERFLQSHEILAAFGGGASATGPLIDRLDEHRRPDGLWDLGARAPWSAQLPLSESWRRTGARAVDWSVRTLGLVSRWLDGA